MKHIILGLGLLFLSPTNLSAQSKEDKQQAQNFYKEAVELAVMSNTRDQAIDLLKKAEDLDPDNLNYPYEIAQVLYKQSKYNEAILYLTKFTFHKNITAQSFEIQGNCYRRLKEFDHAINVLNDGIKKFPKAANLHHAKGVIEYRRKDYNRAMSNWEKGIKADPTFASNYYSLAKLLSYSSETVWAIMYGEVFMNLEPTTERSKEMSQILFDTYKKSIHLNEDPVRVHFTQDAIVPSSEVKDTKPSFPFMYGLTMVKSIVNEFSEDKNELKIEHLNTIRQSFISSWFKQKTNKIFPNILFDFQKKLEKKGFADAYNHWLFMYGDIEAFKSWTKNHEEEFNAFTEWFKTHRAKSSEGHYFSRRNYS